MIRLPLALSLLLLCAAAPAAERRFTITSFDRVRVDGPFEVQVNTGRAPAARATADADTLDRLSVAVDGTTLTIRMGGDGWGERPRTKMVAPVLMLSTPTLRTVQVNGGARVSVTGMKGQRLDLSIAGAGAVTASALAADQVNATIIGPGSMTLAGKAARVRLLANGSGAIDAAGLAASDLTVRLDGTGTVKAAARFTADITSTGLGSVSVAGTPACTINRGAVGPVACGKSQER